ncbi:MAG: glycosyltransferase family 4 protein [Kiritimatiellales bacterium]|nr:glycosyltransferase family 4 protein [Kiritimatiellales bacterium]
MRITYVVHSRFPTEKAHGLQIAAVCSALAEIGHDVTIVAPKTKNYIHDKVHDYYGFQGSIKFIRTTNFDALGKWWIPGSLWMLTTMFFYKRALNKFLENHQADILYTRSPLLLSSLLKSQIPVVLELHTIPQKFQTRFIELCNNCKRIVCLTSPIRDELVKLGVDASKTIVEGDGVGYDLYQDLPIRDGVRKEWNLPTDRPIVGYIGSLVTHDSIEKGIPELLRALKELKDQNVFLWIVGGPDDWINAYKKLVLELGLSDNDVRFQGRVEQFHVSSCIAACDVCVYPAPLSGHHFFQRDTSPLKLLEYLAAGKPVVCADIPPVRDIVDESIVEFCEPGNAQSLADGINKVLSRNNDVRIQAGKEKALHFDWKERMGRVLIGL